MKRVLAFVLAMVCMLFVFPSNSLADKSESDKAEEDPYAGLPKGFFIGEWGIDKSCTVEGIKEIINGSEWKVTPKVSKKKPEFCFVDVNGKLDGGYATWYRSGNGLKFSIRMKNCSDCEEVDAYTFEISAKNAYEEDIKLKSSDGDYCDSLWYTGYNTYWKGTIANTEYFFLEAKEKIRYVTVKLVKYHTESGKFELDEEDQVEYTWTIK